MKIIFLIISLVSLQILHAQKLPPVNFNHLYLVIDSADLSAFQNSDFIKNRFAAFVIRTTKADNGEQWTGTYLQGLDNYIEIFDSVGAGYPTGTAGIGFSVDKVGELNQLDAVLSKKYSTEISLREKQNEDKKIPWFNTLFINDSVFDAHSHFFFWIMEYKLEYYDYNHWKYENNQLTRKIYLSQYEDQRKGKILKKFTGVTLQATEEEIEFMYNFLLNCGYKKIDESSFASPENFIIHFMPRKPGDRYAVASIAFESTMPISNNTVKISEHIEIQFHDKTGEIIFR